MRILFQLSDKSEYRPSCIEVINRKKEWGIELDNMIYDNHLFDICNKSRNNLDFERMEPLSHYIISNKLGNKKQNELLMNIFGDDQHRRDLNDDYDKINKLISAKQLTIDTNFDQQMVDSTKQMVKYSFCVYGTIKLMTEFIAKEMHNLDASIDWECTIATNELQICHNYSLINFQNLKYFCSVFKDDNDKYIFIFIIENSKENAQNMSLHMSLHIIINQYDDDDTEKLIFFANRMLDQTTDESLRVYDYSSQMTLRSLIGFENIFYYITVGSDFLFHSYPEKRKYKMCLNCKFAIKRDELWFTVFTYDFYDLDGHLIDPNLIEYNYDKNNRNYVQICDHQICVEYFFDANIFNELMGSSHYALNFNGEHIFRFKNKRQMPYWVCEY
jgi:hypothetical protein